MDLILHWVFCSVYTKPVKIVGEKLKSIREPYRALAKIPYKSRGNKYYAKLDVFRDTMHTLFDILADKDQCAVLENLWVVKMVKEDFELHKSMSQFPQICYFSSFVHRKWNITNKKKKRKLELQKLRRHVDDDMPSNYRNVRLGEQQVRPEI